MEALWVWTVYSIMHARQHSQLRQGPEFPASSPTRTSPTTWSKTHRTSPMTVFSSIDDFKFFNCENDSNLNWNECKENWNLVKVKKRKICMMHAAKVKHVQSLSSATSDPTCPDSSMVVSRSIIVSVSGTSVGTLVNPSSLMSSEL